MRFLNFLRQIKSRFDNPAHHLLRIELNSHNLLSNIRFFREKFPQYQLGAVLKSNAYGHGLKELGKFLDRRPEIYYLIVDNIVEAEILRDLGVKKPIIILGYLPESVLFKLKRLGDIILIVNSLKQSEILKRKISFSLKVHLKIDTGMHRQGMALEELIPAIKILKENPKIKIEGLMTHLADATNYQSSATFSQLKKWQEALKIFKQYFSRGAFHFAATAGTHYLNYAESNLIRIGLGLYGFDNFSREEEKWPLKPILSFKAKIVNLKEVKKGEGVGYNFYFYADKDLKIAILPCGYFEVIPRAISNSGFVYFRDQPLRILGRISMNQLIIDVSEVKEPLKLEDEIEVISDNPLKLNSLSAYSKFFNVSIYEVMVGLSPFIKRFIK